MEGQMRVFKIIATFVMLSALGSCSGPQFRPDHQNRDLAGELNTEIHDPELKAELETFKLLSEEALVWRALAIEFYKQVKDALEDDGHINHAELLLLHQNAEKYLSLRERIMKIAERREWLSSSLTKVTYEPGAGTHFSKRIGHPWRRAFLPTEVQTVVLDPTDPQGEKALTELKISLAAAMLLLDNYVYGIYPYFQNKHIRYLLNRDYSSTRGKLQEVTAEFVKASNRRKVAKAIAVIHKDLQWRAENNKVPQTNDDFFLELLVSESPTYRHVVSTGKFGGPNSMDYIEGIIQGDLRLTRRSSSFYSSKFFGNTLGLVQFRKGKLKKLPETEKQGIEAAMKPLDILLEKTPFRLTDRFIPGHWGHVAIWVGNEEELRAAGVWDHMAVVPHHEAIRSGRRIVEALRPGVQVNTLEHFLNIDDLLVLRHPTLTAEQQREYLIRTFEQLGKEYDFNFDVETDRKIVCSELAYVVFHNIEWPTQRALGRYTISPDHVAIKGLPGGPLIPIMIYHNGELLPDDHQGSLQVMLKMLLEEKYKELKEYLGKREEAPKDAAVFYKTLMELNHHENE
ncbi:MAG: hypothetical protein A2070_09160 [Bdellovibrionales bacterium GWC1_52_8]|nr:MAG: hypothetical protein A2X97_07975 [Bdellovibrionales bacterium GWA1_52_35]OFZ40517.1 MAG: hypothetical protein A2070_09160 [Bdellovibrionales bacterium GWC1_52_8]